MHEKIKTSLRQRKKKKEENSGTEAEQAGRRLHNQNVCPNPTPWGLLKMSLYRCWEWEQSKVVQKCTGREGGKELDREGGWTDDAPELYCTSITVNYCTWRSRSSLEETQEFPEGKRRTHTFDIFSMVMGSDRIIPCLLALSNRLLSWHFNELGDDTTPQYSLMSSPYSKQWVIQLKRTETRSSAPVHTEWRTADLKAWGVSSFVRFTKEQHETSKLFWYWKPY